MDKSKLGDRMKRYESVNKNFLMQNTATLIRIDGKAFSSFTKGFVKPFCDIVINSMDETAKYLCKNIMGCKIAYLQSDEITLLLTDYDTPQTEQWFGGNIQKIASVSASMATMAFNKAFNYQVSKIKPYPSITPTNEDIKYNNYSKKIGNAMFDSRVFQMPMYEVINCFIWRQQDATRNSIQSLARSEFSPKQTFKKSCDELQDMLILEKNINWNNIKTSNKRGRCVIKEKYLLEDGTERSRWIVDDEIPIFTQDRNYINKYVFIK